MWVKETQVKRLEGHAKLPSGAGLNVSISAKFGTGSDRTPQNTSSRRQRVDFWTRRIVAR